jgi:hypothetical protein
MQNSLFTLNPVTDSDRVTDSDVVFGKTYGKSPHKGFTEKPVTTCHSVTNRTEAVILKANLERRGVLLLAENGVIECDGSSAVIDRFAIDIVRLKPALIQLLNTPDDAAPVAHRWASATGDDVAASATTGSATAAPVIPDDVPLTASEAAAAILDNAYFSNADGNVWKIGWQQPSRSAWRYACLASGGQLIGTNRVPDMDAASAIDWAKQQQQNEVTT